MGFIGLGHQGSNLMSAFMQQTNGEIATLCDVYEPNR
jgi:hypothetical protein